MHYFDWTSTSPISEEALAEYVTVSREFIGNPSSTHPLGIKANLKLSECRNKVAEILKTDSSEIYFTSGGTESDSIIIQSFLNNISPGEIIVTGIEHSAVLENKSIMESKGWKVISLRCPDGFLNPVDLKNALSSKTRLVCIMKVNNVTGSILDTKSLIKVIRDFEKQNGRKIHIHCDAVQALGKIKFEPKNEGFDSAAFSSHKFSGPRGIGILFNSNKNIISLSKGGGQEKGLRPGTENLPAIAAMTKALETAVSHLEENYKVADSYRQYVSEQLKQNNIKIISPSENYSPYILTASFKPTPSEVFLRVMADEGFCLSAGSACSANSRGKAESVLTSMNIKPEDRLSTVRISFSYLNTFDEVKLLSKTLIEKYRELNNGII